MTRLMMRCAWGVALLLAMSVTGLARQMQLPDGEGRSVVEARCVGCHDLDLVVEKRGDRDEWDATIKMMVDLGAIIESDEMPVLVDYLSLHFGREPAVPSAGLRDERAPMIPLERVGMIRGSAPSEKDYLHRLTPSAPSSSVFGSILGPFIDAVAFRRARIL